jgi:hypothetical protein
LRQPVFPELEDIQLHLTIVIANGLISDALNYIKRNKNQRNSVELMGMRKINNSDSIETQKTQI